MHHTIYTRNVEHQSGVNVHNYSPSQTCKVQLHHSPTFGTTKGQYREEEREREGGERERERERERGGRGRERRREGEREGGEEGREGMRVEGSDYCNNMYSNMYECFQICTKCILPVTPTY